MSQAGLHFDFFKFLLRKQINSWTKEGYEIDKDTERNIIQIILIKPLKCSAEIMLVHVHLTLQYTIYIVQGKKYALLH